MISKKDLDSLMSRVETLEETKSKGLQTFKKVKEHTSILRKWAGNYVVGLSNVKEVKAGDKKVLMCDIKVLKDEKTEVVNVDYIDFLTNAERVEVKIIKVETKMIETEQGVTTLKSYDFDKFTGTDTGVHVPIVIETPESKATVLTPDKIQITLDVNALNI